MDVLVDLIATKAAEDKWRLMGATSLAQAKQTFVIRVRRSIGVEAARGLARLRLANLTHVHTFRRGESACKLRQREKSYYYDAREALPMSTRPFLPQVQKKKYWQSYPHPRPIIVNVLPVLKPHASLFGFST